MVQGRKRSEGKKIWETVEEEGENGKGWEGRERKGKEKKRKEEGGTDSRKPEEIYEYSSVRERGCEKEIENNQDENISIKKKKKKMRGYNMRKNRKIRYKKKKLDKLKLDEMWDETERKKEKNIEQY